MIYRSQNTPGSNLGPVSNLDINLNITHPYRGDLVVMLNNWKHDFM
jgi:subtilisin-like proprotein convertase family protein